MLLGIVLCGQGSYMLMLLKGMLIVFENVLKNSNALLRQHRADIWPRRASSKFILRF